MARLSRRRLMLPLSGPASTVFSIWICSRRVGTAPLFGLPCFPCRYLWRVGEALKLDKKKMTEGKELIRYFCIPASRPRATAAGQGTCRPTRQRSGSCSKPTAFGMWRWRCRSGKKLQKFPIPDKEQELYCMDQRINDRGILVDRELITHAAACDLLYKEAASRGRMNCRA